MSIVNGNISIAMTLVEQNSPKNLTRSKEYIAAKVKNPDNNFLTAESAKAATFFSTLSFENVQENIDLEYVLTYDSVKENIVVNAPAHEYNYRFNLVLEGLYPQICNDGSITLYKVGSDISEYIIPSPFMYDAEGNMSESVSYTITKKDESKWELAISADA